MVTHQVFICHASEDHEVAEAVLHGLEERGLGCWIAPRNVTPGKEYAQAIVEAIDASRLIVLIFTESANRSPHVRRELERAVSGDVAILPFRLDETEPSPALAYFISSSQWFDALTPPASSHVDRLADTVHELIDVEEEPTGGAGSRQPAEERSPAPASPARKGRRRLAAVGAAAVLLLAAAAALWAITADSGSDGATDTETTTGSRPTLAPTTVPRPTLARTADPPEPPPGYRTHVDDADGFALVLPETWTEFELTPAALDEIEASLGPDPDAQQRVSDMANLLDFGLLYAVEPATTDSQQATGLTVFRVPLGAFPTTDVITRIGQLGALIAVTPGLHDPTQPVTNNAQQDVLSAPEFGPGGVGRLGTATAIETGAGTASRTVTPPHTPGGRTTVVSTLLADGDATWALTFTTDRPDQQAELIDTVSASFTVLMES